MLQKIFILSGPFKEVRDALLRRGWCENSTKDSHLFDLKWTLYDNEVGYAQLRREQMVNHFQGNGEITTKGLLCRNLRNRCRKRALISAKRDVIQCATSSKGRLGRRPTDSAATCATTCPSC